MLYLTCVVVDAVDFSGMSYYLEPGQKIARTDYAEYLADRGYTGPIDQTSIDMVDKAAGWLDVGQILILSEFTNPELDSQYD
jgi:hypothetical protein